MKLSKMHMKVLKARPAGGPFKLSINRVWIDEHVPEGHYGRYGWEGPNKADKGKRAGSCNRTVCQRPGAFWWNRGSYSWYCTDCAHMLNQDNARDAEEFLGKGEKLCKIDPDAMKEYFQTVDA